MPQLLLRRSIKLNQQANTNDLEIVRMDIPRGKYVGTPQGEPPKDEAEHFYQCEECGGWVDKRDLGSVFDHELGGSHPASDKPQ